MSQVYISILNFSPLSPHWNIRFGRLSPWSSRHTKLSKNCISNFLGSTHCLSLFRRWQFHPSGCSGQKSWKIYLYPLFFPSYFSSRLSKCHWCHLENTSRVILRQHNLFSVLLQWAPIWLPVLSTHSQHPSQNCPIPFLPSAVLKMALKVKAEVLTMVPWPCG